jgi:hypothetical protein
MTTRRAFLFAVLISFATAFSPALSEKTGVLEVTYFYLPG